MSTWQVYMSLQLFLYKNLVYIWILYMIVIMFKLWIYITHIIQWGTTGNACFAEGQISGTQQSHSLPRAIHRSPRQRTALGKEAFAEGTALGKDRPSANQIFAEGRGPRQIRPVGSRRPFPVKLCRGPPVRPSAKVFFSVKPGYSANFFLSLCRGP